MESQFSGFLLSFIYCIRSLSLHSFFAVSLTNVSLFLVSTLSTLSTSYFFSPSHSIIASKNALFYRKNLGCLLDARFLGHCLFFTMNFGQVGRRHLIENTASNSKLLLWREDFPTALHGSKTLSLLNPILLSDSFTLG